MKKEDIFPLLADLNGELLKALSARYKTLNLNITPLQSRLIMCIYESKDKVCQKDLEKLIGCNKSTLSSVLSTMEKNGFIYRQGFEDDTRKNEICLTESSINIVNTLIEDHRSIDKILTEGFSKDELDSFKKFIRKIKSNLERI